MGHIVFSDPTKLTTAIPASTGGVPEYVSLFDRPPVYVRGIVFAIIIVFSILGNFLVITAVYKDTRLHTITNYFISSLAVADLLVSVMIMPFAGMLQLMGSWVFGPLFCTIWTSGDILCCTASILMLCAISLDRYWAISQPFVYHQKMTARRCALIIAFIWIFSTILALAQVLWRFIIESESEKQTCSYTLNKEFRIVSSMSSFFVPLFIMVFTYCKIFSIALSHARAIKAQQTHGQSLSSFSELSQQPKSNGGSGGRDSVDSRRPYHSRMKIKEIKAARTVGIVMSCFVVCWVPFFIMYLLEAFCLSCTFSPEMALIFLWLGYVNSGLNPIIYFFFNKQHRDAYKRLLRPVLCGGCYGDRFEGTMYRNCDSLPPPTIINSTLAPSRPVSRSSSARRFTSQILSPGGGGGHRPSVIVNSGQFKTATLLSFTTEDHPV